MKTWNNAIKDAVVSGSTAAVASALALVACGAAESGHPVSPLNAVSHWIWGDRAFRRNRATVRYTLTGYLTHHCASLFWAVLYEKWLGRPVKSMSETIGDAALASAVACVVDYRFTPERLLPGYEKRLSKKSLLLVYGAFAAGLAAGTVLNSRARY